SLIYQLQQKHRLSSVIQLLEFQSALQVKADKTNNLDESLAAAEKNLKQTEADLRKQAEALSKSRKKVGVPLCKQLIRLLKELGIPEAQMEVELTTIEPISSG